MAIAPWLDLNATRDFTSAMEAGAAAGQRQRQLGDEEMQNFQRQNLSQRELADQESQAAAANALRSQGLMVNHQVALQKLNQSNAALALHQAALQQAQAALQEKNQLIADRENRLASAADELNQWRSGKLNFEQQSEADKSKQFYDKLGVESDQKNQSQISAIQRQASALGAKLLTLPAGDPKIDEIRGQQKLLLGQIDQLRGNQPSLPAAAALTRTATAPQGDGAAASLGDGGLGATRSGLEKVGVIPKTEEQPIPAPEDKTKRVEGNKYVLPNGKIGTWTKDGWLVD